MKTVATKILKYSLWVALAVVLLYFSFRSVKWTDFREVLQSCRWGFVVLAMLAGVLSFVFRALRWRLLLLPEDGGVRVIDCYDGFTIGKVTDFVVPHIGEFVRCGYVSRSRRSLSYDNVLGTVFLERAWDILTLLLLIVLLLAGGWSRFGDFFAARIWEPAAGRLGGGLWWILTAALMLLAALILAFILLRNRLRFCRRIADFLRGIVDGALSCLKMPRKGLFFLLTFCLWTIFLMMSYFIILSLPESLGLGLMDALFLTLVGSVAGIVPVPGGFGAFHYLVALALSTIYGIPWETGIIFATLSHESQAVTASVCGLVSYVRQSFVPKNSE